MKKLLTVLCIVAIAIACDDNDAVPTKTTVKFSLGNSLSSQGGGRLKDFLAPSSILLSLSNNEGMIIHDRYEVDLIAFGNSWISEELQFEMGDYSITEFLVLDETENIIAAAPLTGSEYALLVAKPLPIEFTVGENPGQVDVEVVAVAETDTPEVFGYASFSFEWIIPKRIDVESLIASSEFDASIPIGYTLAVAVKNESGSVVWSHTWNNLANEGSVIVPGGYDQYNFVVSKPGFIPHAQYYLRSQVEKISKLRFELIPEETTEILVFENLDGLGINYYLSADPCVYYARVDFPESFVEQMATNGYVMNDRTAIDGAGVPVRTPNISEVYIGEKGVADIAVNVWPNYTTFPALPSENFCTGVPPAVNDVKYQSILMIGSANNFVVKFHEWN